PVPGTQASPFASIDKAHCAHHNDEIGSSRRRGPMLEVRHLHLVKAIAEEGGVTKAGRRLHLTQSALSHQLRDAEDRLGTRLFDRIGKRMVLTGAGERLLRSARAVLEEMQRAAEKPRGVLRLTTQCNTVYHWLPSRLRLYQRSFPGVELQVVAGVTDDP